MKKFLSLLLAVMMFALPVASYADAVQYTASMQHGTLSELLTVMGLLPDASYATAIDEMMDCVSFQAYAQDGQAGIAVQLNGENAITADVALTENAILFGSNLLGNDVIAVSFDELGALITRMLEESGIDLSVWEQLLAEADFSDLSFDNTIAAVMELVSSITTEEVTEQPAGCDPATQKISFVMTGEQMTNYVVAFYSDLLSCKFIGKCVETFAATMGTSMTVDQVMEALTSSVSEVYNKIGQIPVEVYLNAEGELVYMSESFAIEEAAFDVCIVRNTTAEGTQYDMQYTIGAGTDSVALLATLSMQDKQHGICTLRIQAEGLEDTIFAFCWAEEADSRVEMLSVMLDEEGTGFVVTSNTQGSGIESVTTTSFALSGNSLTSLVSNPTLFSVIESLTVVADHPALTGNEVHPASMSEEELSTWASGLTMTALPALMGAMQNLPASVLMLVFGAQ